MTRLKVNSVAVLSVLALSACATKEEPPREYYRPATNSQSANAPKSSAAALGKTGDEDLSRSTKFTALSQNIRFEPKSATLSASNRRALDGIADEMKKSLNTFETVRVTGFSDAVGDSSENQNISEQRALAVQDYLVKKGIPEEKIEAIGMGAVQSDMMGSESQQARDRRVDFEIVE
ncbi:OmpA family protein [Bdellovibrio bacteriovorus]|uniref:OmpA family protein n=1 Tax=Bdellovibrio bacteriovorus TaxID=959 RepID=UPI0035A5BFA6